MPKLKDTQLVILSAAAQRDSGAALPLSKSLKIKGAAVTMTLDSLRKQGLLEEKPAPHDAIAWREGEDGGRMMLVITPAGLKAIEGEATSGTLKSKPAKSQAPRANQAAVSTKQKRQKAAPTARAGKKQGVLITLLQRKNGATIDDMVAATGWQAHSVRGAISGVLKKKLGLAVSSEKVAERGRVYRIAGRG
jgi:hypothetical protein